MNEFSLPLGCQNHLRGIKLRRIRCQQADLLRRSGMVEACNPVSVMESLACDRHT